MMILMAWVRVAFFTLINKIIHCIFLCIFFTPDTFFFFNVTYIFTFITLTTTTTIIIIIWIVIFFVGVAKSCYFFTNSTVLISTFSINFSMFKLALIPIITRSLNCKKMTILLLLHEIYFFYKQRLNIFFIL